ncbi:MAG: trypsin-like peptidase domain-containing protein [Anaerovoracaceae bacterium]
MDNNKNNEYEGDNFVMVTPEPKPDDSQPAAEENAHQDNAYHQNAYQYNAYQGNAYQGNAYQGQFQSGGTQGKTHGVKSNFVTKKVFVATLILCMFFSTALGFGGYALASNLGVGTVRDTKNITATNYNISKSTGSELSIQEIVAKNENSVVEIRTESVANDIWAQQYITEGAGSGVVMASNGYIITNNHVIEGANKITVTMHNGNVYKAKLVGTDPLTDIAVIKVNANGLTPITYGQSSKLAVGDLAVAIGNPLGQLGGSATAGIISALDRDLTLDGKKMTLLQTDASINPGNSGGGLFNQYGQLIGIVVAKSSGSDVEGLGFAIPSERVAKVAASLAKDGHVSGRPAIGITIQDLSSAQDAMQFGYKMTGVYIAKVTSKNAKNAGLQAGDMLYYLEDTQIDSSATFLAEVQKHKVGETVKLIVIRDNKTIEVKVKLSEAKN